MGSEMCIRDRWNARLITPSLFWEQPSSRVATNMIGAKVRYGMRCNKGRITCIGTNGRRYSKQPDLNDRVLWKLYMGHHRRRMFGWGLIVVPWHLALVQ